MKNRLAALGLALSAPMLAGVEPHDLWPERKTCSRAHPLLRLPQPRWWLQPFRPLEASGPRPERA